MRPVLLALALFAVTMTALLFVGSFSAPATAQGNDPDCSSYLPGDAVTIDDVTGWRDDLDPVRAAPGIKRFNRVLEAFGVDTESNVSAMTAEQAQAVSTWLGNDRWDRIARTLAALKECADADDGNGGGTPPPTPEISISGGSSITEGGNAVFTLTASPAPAANLNVTVSVTQSGDFASSTGTQTVTIPTGGSATLSIATNNDNTDEADGSVTATVNSGNGYTVGSASAATVSVSDNDVPEISISGGSDITEGGDATFTLTASPTPHATLSVSVTVTQSGAFASSTGTQSVTIPTGGSATLTVGTNDDSTDEANGSITATINNGSGYTIFTASATVNVADNDVTQDDDDDTSTSCLPTDAVTVAEVTAWRDALHPVNAAPGVRRFNRVLEKLGVDTGVDESPMSHLEAQSVYDRLQNTRWDRIARTLTAMWEEKWDDSCDATPPPADPVVSIAGGPAVTEGGNAVFTLTASPAPAANLDVTVSVTQSGDFASSTGTKTVTIPTGGSATLTVGTTNDNIDEADGSVTATVNSGSGYTVGSASAATINVADDDVPPPSTPVVTISGGSSVTEGGNAVFTLTASPAPAANLDVTVSVTQSGDFASSTGTKTVTIPTGGSATLTVGTTNDNVDEADGSVTATVNSGSGYTVGSASAATINVADDDVPAPTTPVVSISGGSGITEGGNAVFTLTASPAPAANLDVTVSVSQSGDFASSTGTQTVTIPTGGSATLTVGTTNDNVDEADGSVTATVNSGSGYTVGSASAATIDVQDDDVPPPSTPEISISAGNAVTEGGNAVFTLTASPAPAANLDVTVSVSQSGDYASSTGTQTVTIPTTGSATLTVGTTDDSNDESNGSVTATVSSGSGYTVGSASAATIDVQDNDAPKPYVKSDVSITAGPDITEGEDATFTVTADPAPAAKLRIILTVKQEGNYAIERGARYFTIPTSGSATLRVRTLNDAATEADGSITATIIYGGRHYNVGKPWQATLNVSDNDAAFVDSRPPRTDITWADFWAPYEELIADIYAVRNDKVLRISKSHTDFWDSVLVAFGREVDDEYMNPMSVEGAEIYAGRQLQLFDRIAPALKEIWDNGPPPVNPGEAPEQTTAFPDHIAITGGATSKTLTLTDYFADPEGEDLIFTVDFTGSTMTATLSGADLTLALNTGLSRGGGDLTVTASDGQLTDTATAHVVVGCGSSATWDEQWGFCLAAATSNSFSGGAEGDGPGAADFTTGNHTAQVTKFEGESGSIRVLVYPDVLSDSNAGNDNTCNMRGYLSIQDADGIEITNTNSMETGTWSVRVTGAGFVNSPAKAANREGSSNVAGLRRPGWNDTSCGNDALTTHKYRQVIVEYNIPADEMPGTTLNGIKLMFHDLGSSGTITQASHEVMTVTIKDTISEVTHPAMSRADIGSATVVEGTGASAGFTLSSDDKLVGYLAVVVDGAEPNERPDLTQTSSNPQNGWWAEITGVIREAYFNPTIWAHLNSGVLPKWTSSGTYGVSTGVWHRNAVWIRSASSDYTAGDEPGGSNNGWAPLIRSGNTFTSGRAGSNNGSNRDTPTSIPAWSPSGNYGYDVTAHTFVWNEHDTKLYIRENKDIGVFTPVDNFEEQMLAAYRDNGPAMQMNLRLSGGGKLPWLDNQDCFFGVTGGTRDNPVTATCLLTFAWDNNGYVDPDQKIEFWWVELESYDAGAPVKFRTRLGEWTLRDSGVNGRTTHTGRYWVEFQNADGSGYSATATQPLKETHSDYTNRQDRVRGYIVTNQNPIVAGGNNDRVVAVEVRRGTTRAGALANFKQPLNEYVGRSAFTIDGQAHREFYLLGSTSVPCNEAGYQYSCFGGEGNWTKVSGRNIWRTPFNLSVHDDNYVGEKLRYYVFTVKDSTSGYVPTLEVKEDDHLQITLKPDLALNGKMDIHSHRASYQHYSFRLEARGSIDSETGWDNWDVTIDNNWHGSASAYSLGDDSKGPDEHPGCPNGGAGWVRAVFTNWDGLSYGVSLKPDPSPSDHNYQPDDANTRYSGWVQVCK